MGDSGLRESVLLLFIWWGGCFVEEMSISKSQGNDPDEREGL